MYQFFISILILFIPLVAKAQTWDFAVSMNGKPIGTHQFILTDAESNQKVLKSEANFNIKILSINFFQYHHQANELWENNCLQKLEADTQENGKTTIRKIDHKDILLVSDDEECPSVEGISSAVHVDKKSRD